MLVYTLVDEKNGKKWEVYKNLNNNNYSYKYFEYFKVCGWHFVSEDKFMSKDSIEWLFDIKVA